MQPHITETTYVVTAPWSTFRHVVDIEAMQSGACDAKFKRDFGTTSQLELTPLPDYRAEATRPLACAIVDAVVPVFFRNGPAKPDIDVSEVKETAVRLLQSSIAFMHAIKDPEAWIQMTVSLDLRDDMVCDYFFDALFQLMGFDIVDEIDSVGHVDIVVNYFCAYMVSKDTGYQPHYFYADIRKDTAKE